MHQLKKRACSMVLVLASIVLAATSTVDAKVARTTLECFSPVAGYKSLIPVEDRIARTADIDEQPKTERLDVFFAKIRKLLRER